MTEIPYLTNVETEVSAYPAIGQGGSDVMLFMGKTDNAADLDQIHEIYSYWQAEDLLGPASATNELLSGIYSAFLEGSKRQNYTSPTISKIYAIEMGPSPTKGDYETAAENSEIKRDIDLEVYLNNYGVTSYTAHMVATGVRLDELQDQNDYRQAIFTLDPLLTVDEKVIFTDPLQGSYVRDHRVIIHENNAMQAKYAAKVACTPYYLEPSLEPYRSANVDEINQYKYSDLEKLITAGIVADYATPSTNPALKDTVTPVRSVSTAHVLDNGTRGLDTNTHVRRNLDYNWWATDLIATEALKQNNTELAREHLINAVTSHFEQQVKIGAVIPQRAAPEDPGYYVDAIPDETDQNKIRLLRGMRPTPATYFIEINSDIYGPALQNINAERLRAW